jgi:hypothetical protein
MVLGGCIGKALGLPGALPRDMLHERIKALLSESGNLPAFTSVGCYTLVYLCEDGGCLCAECAASEDAKEQDDKQWNVTACDVYWEGPPMQCDHCNAEIESAYGDPDAEQE